MGIFYPKNVIMQVFSRRGGQEIGYRDWECDTDIELSRQRKDELYDHTLSPAL